MIINLEEVRNDKKWQAMRQKDQSLKGIFDELDKIIGDMERNLTIIKTDAKAKGIKPATI